MKLKVGALLVFFLELSGFSTPAVAGQFVAARENGVSNQYIVVLKENLPSVGLRRVGSPDERARDLALFAEKLAHRRQVRVEEVWRGIGLMLVTATEREARSLANDPRVARVEQDMTLELSAVKNCQDHSQYYLNSSNSYNPSSPQTIQCWDPRANCTDNWGLDRIDQRSGSESQHTLDGKFYFGATGQGVHIYLIDTGIAANHSEFLLPGGGSRIGNGTNVAPDHPAWDTYDDCGHGTLVASTAAGRRFGVAKGATLHPVRVGKPCTSTIARLCAGLDWVVLNRQLPAVVNLSWNFPIQAPNDPAEDPSALDYAVHQTIATYGIPVVNSAGNYNQDAGSFSPTWLPEVIVVGGLDWLNNQRWGADAPNCHVDHCGSNWGPSVDLLLRL
ncbi:MAG: hypothetical protein QOH06_3245 [Acidobacteriota bacterium]|jgi:hypothetical protein|nr:hypothetical protein [Acidobacteriota bacterium]